MDLNLANVSPRATPYRTGLPINSILGDKNAPQDRIKQYQSWVSSLTWLSISTRADLSSVVSFLSSFNHKLSVQNMVAAKHLHPSSTYCSKKILSYLYEMPIGVPNVHQRIQLAAQRCPWKPSDPFQ
eukprot:6967061-Ditylum_brightwellii.AAC.1